MLDTKYVRLLSYENACKLIEYVNRNDTGKIGDNYANITVGGVCVQLKDDESLLETIEFLNGMGVRYEMSGQPPHETEKQIVKTLKEKGVIVTKD